MPDQEYTREELDELRISVARAQYQYLLQKQDYEFAELTYYTNKGLQAVKEHAKLLRQLKMLPESSNITTLSKEVFEEKDKELREAIKENDRMKVKMDGLLNSTNNNMGAIMKFMETELKKKEKMAEALHANKKANEALQKEAAIVTPTKEKNKVDTNQKTTQNKRRKNNEPDCSNAKKSNEENKTTPEAKDIEGIPK